MRSWQVTTPIIEFVWDETVPDADHIEILDEFAARSDNEIDLVVPYNATLAYDRNDPAVVFRTAIEYCRQILDMEPEIESESIEPAEWDGKIKTGELY